MFKLFSPSATFFRRLTVLLSPARLATFAVALAVVYGGFSLVPRRCRGWQDLCQLAPAPALGRCAVAAVAPERRLLALLQRQCERLQGQHQWQVFGLRDQ